LAQGEIEGVSPVIVRVYGLTSGFRCRTSPSPAALRDGKAWPNPPGPFSFHHSRILAQYGIGQRNFNKCSPGKGKRRHILDRLAFSGCRGLRERKKIMRKFAGPAAMALLLVSGTPVLAQTSSSSGQASGNGAAGGYSNTTNTPSASGTAGVTTSGHKAKSRSGRSSSGQDSASMPGYSNNGTQTGTNTNRDNNTPGR
jgi:hypothetical protein